MKQIKFNKPKISKKTKLIVILVLVVILLGLLLVLFKTINTWYDKHYFKFNQPVVITLNKPIEIKEREIKIQQIIERMGYTLPTNLTPIETYICEKFGPLDCKLALAIAKAESGMKADSYNYNTNDTIDIGIFMVNQVHWKQAGCSPKELFDPYKNVDCAYSIWQASGWEPWVVYNTGSFKNHLK